MEQRDKPRFAEALAGMGEMYDKTVTTSLASMYFADLAEHSIDAVLGAMAAHRKDPDRGRFFPRVADVIHQINAARLNASEAAMLAWVEVPKLLQNSRAAKAADPITERVVSDLGGWVALGRKSPSELVWIAKEFAERYAIYADRGMDVQALTHERTGLRLIGRDGR